MRTAALILMASATLAAAPATAQDFLGRIARGAAESAAQGLANQAVRSVTTPRPSTPAAAAPVASRQAAPAPAPAPASAASTPASPAEQPAAPAASSGGMTLVDHMDVITSDGTRVAETLHVINGRHTYGAEQSFFTADRYYALRRFYPDEATVRGNAVHLRMTAAQFRARSQNPPAR